MLVLLAAPAGAQTPKVEVTLGGRSQIQWNTSSVDADETGGTLVPASTFETRRIRLAAGIAVDDWITGLIEPEFALGQLRLRNAWVALALDSGFVVRAGQMKKPFGLVHLTSSTTIPVIERGLRIRGLEDAVAEAEPGAAVEFRGTPLLGELHSLLEGQGYAAYDMGVTLEADALGLSWEAGVYNGTGPDSRDHNDGKSLAARVRWSAPLDVPLHLGAAWSRREFLTSAATAESDAGNAWGAELELGGLRRGAWILAEASTGDNLASGERFVGAHVIGSWFIPTGSQRLQGWEPVARVSWADPDTEADSDAGMLVTPGVNLYFFGRNRLMLGWDVYMPQTERLDWQHAMRAQLNLHF